MKSNLKIKLLFFAVIVGQLIALLLLKLFNEHFFLVMFVSTIFIYLGGSLKQKKIETK